MARPKAMMPKAVMVERLGMHAVRFFQGAIIAFIWYTFKCQFLYLR
jgi:hypothetical protein